MKKNLLLLILLLVFPIFCAADTGDRVALIIGNNTYEGYFSSLNTPINDANGIDYTLRTLGFKTLKATDLTREQTLKKIKEFSKLAKGASVALFYYSGHGCCERTENNTFKNYMVPKGKYEFSSMTNLDFIDLNAIQSAMKGASLKLFFIDACQTELGIKGTAVFSPDLLDNEYNEEGIAWYYGTELGEKAYTGQGKFSIFTRSLLNYMAVPNTFFDNKLWPKIQREVLDNSSNQTPTSLISENFTDFKFNPQGIKFDQRIPDGKITIKLKATPENSKITIKGKEFKNPADVIINLNADYEISITADGYKPVKDTLHITPNPYMRTEYVYNLANFEPASLMVSSNLKKVNVSLDGIEKQTPAFFNTTAGPHELSAYKKGYYIKRTQLNLEPGENFQKISLYKDLPWFFDQDDQWNYSSPSHIINYHYSPKYQIGLSYMINPKYLEYFCFGAHIATSTGLFGGVFSLYHRMFYINASASATIGGDPDIETEKEKIDGTKMEYSSFVDPYNEAKYYDSNFLIMASAGFLPCNGILITLGLGAASHCDKYYMKNTYFIERTITYNKKTGETSTSDWTYTKNDNSYCYTSKVKWSPAIRLGGIFYIPTGSAVTVSLGGGYTYLPMNHGYSSWDVCAGLTFYID